MICVRLRGGLGNQMFQYALAKRLALKHDTSVGIDTFCFKIIVQQTQMLYIVIMI